MINHFLASHASSTFSRGCVRGDQASASDSKKTWRQRQQTRLLGLYSHINENMLKNQWLGMAV